MTFKEAQEKLEKLANGKHHALSFEYFKHTTGNVGTTCSVYIEDVSWFCGDTFAQAFDKLEQAMGITKVEETPDISDESLL